MCAGMVKVNDVRRKNYSEMAELHQCSAKVLTWFSPWETQIFERLWDPEFGKWKLFVLLQVVLQQLFFHLAFSSPPTSFSIFYLSSFTVSYLPRYFSSKDQLLLDQLMNLSCDIPKVPPDQLGTSDESILPS